MILKVGVEITVLFTISFSFSVFFFGGGGAGEDDKHNNRVVYLDLFYLATKKASNQGTNGFKSFPRD